MIDEYDVTITEASLSISRMSDMPAVALEFLPHALCFFDSRVVGRLYCHMSNEHPKVGWKRARLRSALSMVVTEEPFNDKELSYMIGRLMRVVVEPLEFRDRLYLRVVDFKCYSGRDELVHYSDNEYVFMIRELLQEVK